MTFYRINIHVLCSARKASGLSGKRIAFKAGISANYYEMIESGFVKIVSQSVVEKLEKVLNNESIATEMSSDEFFSSSDYGIKSLNKIEKL